MKRGKEKNATSQQMENLRIRQMDLYELRRECNAVGKVFLQMFLFAWMVLGYFIIRDLDAISRTCDMQEIWKGLETIVPWITIASSCFVILMRNVMTFDGKRLAVRISLLVLYGLLTQGIGHLMINKKIFEAVLLYLLCMVLIELLILLYGWIWKGRKLKSGGNRGNRKGIYWKKIKRN